MMPSNLLLWDRLKPALPSRSFVSYRFSRRGNGRLLAGVAAVLADYSQQLPVDVGPFADLHIGHALLIDEPQQHPGEGFVQMAQQVF